MKSDGSCESVSEVQPYESLYSRSLSMILLNKIII